MTTSDAMRLSLDVKPASLISPLPPNLKTVVGRVAAAECFTASVSGPYASGKTWFLASVIEAVVECRLLQLTEIACFAPTRQMFNRLAALVAKNWPEFEYPSRELFERELCGIPYDGLAGHTALEGNAADRFLEGMAAREWREFAKRTTENAPDTWLDQLDKPFRHAFRVDRHARLMQTPLPLDTYLAGVRAFVADVKERHGLVDRADLLAANYIQSPEVRLLCFDEVDEPDQKLLLRYFPNASVIATSVKPRPRDIVIRLTRSRRTPRILDVVADSAVLAPPPPEGYDSLFVICAKWRRGQWLAWMIRYGIPLDERRFRAICAAWRYDAEQEVPHWAINPLLKEVGLEPQEAGSVAVPDIAGWTDWRDMGKKYDSRALAQAEAVLARYGRLTDLPLVKMGSPNSVRGLEAEVVYVDVKELMPGLDELAASRAAKTLVIFER